MTLRLHNTLTGRKESFTPADPNRVTLYVCGPTVYNHPHIGNARPAVVFDVLNRVLRQRFGKDNVIYARNITDIEDKIIAASKETGTPWQEITEHFAAVYNGEMAELNVLAPDIEPKATDHVDQMIAMNERLIAVGHAYEADGHVLFDVPSWEDYGRLSNRNRDDMIAGARVEVAPYKQDPADFILWKPAADDEPGWDSPWGRGRPGWHIECSAMSETHLGTSIDIHGGGQDLIFPHHENEIAQSTCSHDGAPFAHYWMHNGFVNVDAEKMSKSIGNVLLVTELLNDAPGEAIRLALLSAHYRQPLDWTENGLSQARRNLDRLYGTLEALGAEPEDGVEASVTLGDAPVSVVEALEDDLNTPQAMAALFALMRDANTASGTEEKAALRKQIKAAGLLLGILQQDPRAWFEGDKETGDGPSLAEIDQLLQDRAAARANKDFATADTIRDDLAAQGIVIEDGPDGAKWKRVS